MDGKSSNNILTDKALSKNLGNFILKLPDSSQQVNFF